MHTALACEALKALERTICCEWCQGVETRCKSGSATGGLLHDSRVSHTYAAHNLGCSIEAYVKASRSAESAPA